MQGFILQTFKAKQQGDNPFLDSTTAAESYQGIAYTLTLMRIIKTLLMIFLCFESGISLTDSCYMNIQHSAEEVSQREGSARLTTYLINDEIAML